MLATNGRHDVTVASVKVAMKRSYLCSCQRKAWRKGLRSGKLKSGVAIADFRVRTDLCKAQRSAAHSSRHGSWVTVVPERGVMQRLGFYAEALGMRLLARCVNTSHVIHACIVYASITLTVQRFCRQAQPVCEAFREGVKCHPQALSQSWNGKLTHPSALVRLRDFSSQNSAASEPETPTEQNSTQPLARYQAVIC